MAHHSIPLGPVRVILGLVLQHIANNVLGQAFLQATPTHSNAGGLDKVQLQWGLQNGNV